MNDQLVRNLLVTSTFAFEGTYYQLPRPTVFVVRGAATPVANNTSTVEDIGLADRGVDFISGLHYWTTDASEFTSRIDIENGSFKSVLLEENIRRHSLQAEYAGKMSMAMRGGRMID